MGSTITILLQYSSFHLLCHCPAYEKGHTICQPWNTQVPASTTYTKPEAGDSLQLCRLGVVSGPANRNYTNSEPTWQHHYDVSSFELKENT